MSELGGEVGSLIDVRKPDAIMEVSFERDWETLEGMYSSDVVKLAKMKSDRKQNKRTGNGRRRPRIREWMADNAAGKRAKAFSSLSPQNLDVAVCVDDALHGGRSSRQRSAVFLFLLTLHSFPCSSQSSQARLG